ncbi:MAG: c-type cytochrome [Anaerolineae bacterium]|nr:c-type cytochrome [Anaerolineae bacterium]
MKKFAVFTLILLLAASLVGCGAGAEATATPALAEPSPTAVEEASPTAEVEATPTVEAVASPSPEAEVGETPAAVAVGDPEIGVVVFRQNCSGCHGTQAGGGIGPTLAGTGLPFETVLEKVRTGPSDMPAFPPEQVSDEDVAHILAWLQSLS